MKNGNLTVVMYHYVRELALTRYPNIKGLNLSLFKEQLKYLQKHYHFVTVEECISAFYNREALPSKAILITFDDAYIEHYTSVFPLLFDAGVQGAFYAPVKAVTEHVVLDVNKIHFILSAMDGKMPFLLKEIAEELKQYEREYTLRSFDDYYSTLAKPNRFDNQDVIFVKRLLQVELVEEVRKKIVDHLFTRFVSSDEAAFSQELYMSEEQMRLMNRCGMHIGSHGYDHYWLGSLSKERQRDEIIISLDFLRRIGSDISNWTICYPYGNYNEDTLDVLKEKGCKLGFTTIAEIADCNINNPFVIPRLDTNDFPKEANAKLNSWFSQSY